MKVLFYALYDPAQITFTAQYCDYMVDCLFHGFRSLLGSDCIDYHKMPQWYDTINKAELYGNGFTIFGLCPDIEIDRDDLDHKIESGYFDQIIVAIHNNRYRNQENIEVIKQLIGPKNNVIKVICGNDRDFIDTQISAIVPFFKRELYQFHNNVYPINFCVPKEKIVTSIPIKTKNISDEKPNNQGKQGWKIKNEEEYYQKYRESIFALTHKKCGWDCMRHYEILMNGCIPLFTGIKRCPAQTLYFLPKLNLENILHTYVGFSEDDIIETIAFLLSHTRQYLTTEAMAKYILETK
jgi:hypothetical protein